jgi:hypothetical protein
VAPSVAVGAQGSFVIAWDRRSFSYNYNDQAPYSRDGSGSAVIARRFCDSNDASCDVCRGSTTRPTVTTTASPTAAIRALLRCPLRRYTTPNSSYDSCVRALLADLEAPVSSQAIAGSVMSNATVAPGTPLKRNRLRISGTFSLAGGASTFSSLDPSMHGARVRIENVEGRAVVDQRLPAGTFAGDGTRGWTLNMTGRVWRYRDRTRDPLNGFRTAIFEGPRSARPDMVQVTVKGGGGVYAVRESPYCRFR